MNAEIAVAEKEVAINTKKWYIVETRSNYEKKVLASLIANVEASGIADQFGEILVPVEQVVEVVKGTAKRTTRKFYPRYVFIEVDFDEAAWHLIKNTTHVQRFVGGSPTRPAPISAKEMGIILDRMKATEDAPAHKQEFEIGQTLLVTAGPFKDFEGTVDDVNYNQNKVRVSISIFGRPTPMDIDFAHVAKTN